ncbi:MAG: hypothetical protein UZ17_ACD001000815 [Acidobacteria bacterium OLB17]|nr:MAG: hypothetical protein UZ17_ACD001000815 [Acidobacteria bacterium OLB17]MCZ2389743.1 hypothetical protein [Acidobacteriota bacterium]
MFEFLTSPSYPNAGLGIEERSITAATLEGNRSSLRVRQCSTNGLAPGIVAGDFFGRNILDESAFVRCLEDTLAAAGLLNQKRWSVSLPGSSARTAIVTLEAEPSAKGEWQEIFDWKAEQAFGLAASELRMSRKKISNDAEGRSRYFTTAIRLSVIDEYETLFERSGWRAGLILPRVVSEAAWLYHGAAGDALLLSAQPGGFSGLLLRGDEPAVVRSVTCTPAEAGNEIYRLLMFYHDRYGGILENILLVGEEIDRTDVVSAAAEAFGREIDVMDAADVGLDLSGTGLAFDVLAAPAGLASLHFGTQAARVAG